MRSARSLVFGGHRIVPLCNSEVTLTLELHRGKRFSRGSPRGPARLGRWCMERDPAAPSAAGPFRRARAHLCPACLFRGHGPDRGRLSRQLSAVHGARSLGYAGRRRDRSARGLESGAGAYAVRKLAIHYRAPTRLGDELAVVSRLARLRSASVDIHQRVMCREIIVAEAEVEAAFVSPSGRPRRQPSA